jgi:hypothetical protein
MRRAYIAAALWAAAFWLAAPTAQAQWPTTQLQFIFPCGARAGTTVECTTGPGEVATATGLYFSHPGITARASGSQKFHVTVAADVPVGRYDVRAICPAGLSSCRSFVVGDRPEFSEQEPNDSPDRAQTVTLPCVVNGQMGGGIDLDYFVFAAKRGQRVLLNCWAARIDSAMDATLMIYDGQGREVAYAGDYYGKDPLLDFTAPADGNYTAKVWDFTYSSGSTNFYRLEIGSLPHLDAVLPAAIRPGQTLTVTLLGRNLGGKPAPAGWQIQGRPLETLTREISAPPDPDNGPSLHAGEAIRPPQASLDGMDYRLATPEGQHSNPLFIAFTHDVVALEHEPNDRLETAQRLSVPCEVSGTFSPVGDKDYFAFTATKGQRLVVEVYGERQSGLVDPILAGFDAKGNRLTTGDDIGRNIGQLRFTTTTRDSRWDFNVPADGEYFVQVRDLYFQQRGEPRFTYRMSVRPLRPDFRLMAVPVAEVLPDATTIGQGANHWLDVLAFRNDGFEDPIEIEAVDLPPGVTCEKVTIGPGKTSVPLVFHAAPDAPLGEAEIRILGRATIDGAAVTRRARGGGLIWATVNTPGVARMTDTIVLAVRERAPFTLSAQAAKTSLAAGEKLAIQVGTSVAPDWSGEIQLSGFDLPDKATLPLVTVRKGSTSAQVELTLPPTLKPGPYTFTIHGSGQVPRNYAIERDPSKPRGNNMRMVATSNPITITVVAPKG